MAQGSVQAQNRTIEDWFQLVRAGTLKLPRFQRHEAWDRSTVVSLLETVLRGLPAGAALVLNVGEPEPFVSRHLVTAPQVEGRVTEHLLDGQQRLTALWRSLYGTYDDLTLFVTWEPDPDHEDEETVDVVSQPRWMRDGKRYPVWCDDPRAVFDRGYLPVTLLAPDAHDRASDWLQAACLDTAEVLRWINKLSALRQRVAAYNIPYLYLPQSTPRDVALDVFVKMNTSNIRLTPFDIVVAQVEAAAGASMHEILEGIGSEVPSASAYGDLGTLLLDVACLHAGRTASKANYLRLDYQKLSDQWKQMVEPLRFMVSLLEGEGIYDGARLPTSAVLAVVAALAKEVPTAGDGHGNARTLLRYYLWRAFLTRRYESTTATRSYQDFIALRDALRAQSSLADVTAPIFDEASFPLPNEEQLLSTRWPKTRDILARGVLALSLREGGRDIADDTPATRDSVLKREYHHLFPDSTLVKRAKYDAEESFRALNCVLITWQTNRKVSNLSPLQYLKDRVDAALLGEDAIAARLASHLVPWGTIKVSGPYPDGCDSQQIRNDYEAFLRSRAALVVVKAAERAGAGKVGTHAAPRTTSLERARGRANAATGENVTTTRQQVAVSTDDTPNDADVLVKQFDAAMRDVYVRAKREAGYDATAYLRMLADHGGLGTAKRLLATDSVSAGFVALWERNRVDLAVENVVLQPEFASLFTDGELETARRRLKEYEVRRS